MIYLYSKRHSEGGKRLIKELKGKLIKRKHSQFIGHKDKIVLNWGACSLPAEVSKCTIINTPEAVQEASNKLSFFKLIKHLNITPEWTEDKDYVRNRLDAGECWLARRILSGSGGHGLDILQGPKFIDAPLYVKYKKKKEEYRVHIFNNTIIDKQRKAKRNGVEVENYKIRNLNNGFVFVREGMEVPPSVEQVALLSMQQTSLVFGAVDVIWNDYEKKAYVLEVNTAPGLEGQTVVSYTNAMRKYINE